MLFGLADSNCYLFKIIRYMKNKIVFLEKYSCFSDIDPPPPPHTHIFLIPLGGSNLVSSIKTPILTLREIIVFT